MLEFETLASVRSAAATRIDDDSVIIIIISLPGAGAVGPNTTLAALRHLAGPICVWPEVIGLLWVCRIIVSLTKKKETTYLLMVQKCMFIRLICIIYK